MKISVVTTLFHSAPYIREFYRRTVTTIKKVSSDFEIIFVNDGSPDHSRNIVLELQSNDHGIILIDLSRNFGHHRAIMTGLQFAQGDYVFLIDADLEEDPETFGLLWDTIKNSQDIDMVYGVQQKRKGGLTERLSGKFFYRFFHFIAGFEYPADTLTARIMTKRYINALKNYREKEFDIWGLFLLNGFSHRAITLNKKSKGSSTYTLKRKFKIAVDSITSLTSRPLYYIFILGFVITTLAFLNFLYILYRKVIHNITVEGWASILASVWFIGGIIMFTLGIIAIYLSKIFLEVKNRPLTVIKKIHKIEKLNERNKNTGKRILS